MKQATIARDSPYSWQYTLRIPGTVSGDRQEPIRHWIRKAPKTEHWRTQISREITYLRAGLVGLGYVVTVKESNG